MVVAWLLFPLVMLAVCLGCGLTVEWAAGQQSNGALVLSVGLALVIVVASLLTNYAFTAPLTTAVVGLLAILGYASSWRRVRAMRPEPWTLGVGIAVYAVAAAPVVLSGSASFLGYFVLNDAAIHFSLISQLLGHGRDISYLTPSSYFATLQAYLSSSYPTGADVALGAISPIVGQDVAWLFQPYLAVILALGGSALYVLLETVRPRVLRAAAAFLASQAGLVYAYYLEASIKEVATTWVITVTVVLVFATLRRAPRLRGLIPVAVVAVAGFYILDVAIAPWLALPLAVLVVASAWKLRHAVRRQPRGRLAAASAGGIVVLGVLLVPIISRASTFLSTAQAVLTNTNTLGNLFGPLPKWEMFGIWPVGDFRTPVTSHYRIAYALIGIAIASGVLGTIWAIRRRLFAPVVLLLGNGIVTAYLLTRGSPYANAKVMMIFSLTSVFTAMLGPIALHNSDRRIEGWLLAIAIGAGVLWTTALGYHNASIAPRDRLSELASIGTRFTGKGPTFYNLSDEFAAYFLRGAAPADPAIGPPLVRTGLHPPAGRLPWDPDLLDPSYLQSFKLLVLPRSPLFSRPPANYQRVYQGNFYEVWQRQSAPRVLEHVPLGGPLYPASVPRCSVVTSTAAAARRDHARLAYVERTPVPTLIPAQATHPSTWLRLPGDPFSLVPQTDAGAVFGQVAVPQAGDYQVWLEGSISKPVHVSVGGHPVGPIAHQLGPPGQTVHVGNVTLAAGNQPVTIALAGKNLSPGDGGTGLRLGPLMLVRDTGPPAVSETDPSNARSLCGRSLDWIEIVR